MRNQFIKNVRETRELIRKYRRLAKLLRKQYAVEFSDMGYKTSGDFLETRTGFGQTAKCTLCVPCINSMGLLVECEHCVHILNKEGKEKFNADLLNGYLIPTFPCTAHVTYHELNYSTTNKKLSEALLSRAKYLRDLILFLRRSEEGEI